MGPVITMTRCQLLGSKPFQPSVQDKIGPNAGTEKNSWPCEAGMHLVVSSVKTKRLYEIAAKKYTGLLK